MPEQDPSTDLSAFFRLFNEIGILSQLSRTQLQERLPEGLQVPHFTVLNHLVRVRDGQTPQALAQAFQVAKTTMTHTLAGLVKAGLVEMRPNPRDARSKTVWLTQAGRAQRQAAIMAMAPAMAELGKRFSPARAAALVPELTALREIMDASRDQPAES